MRSTQTGHHSHPRRRTELTDSGPSSHPYSPKCLEEEFSEVRMLRVLCSSPGISGLGAGFPRSFRRGDESELPHPVQAVL
jgi:hypothetical protein